MHTKNIEIKQCSTINTKHEVNGTDYKYYKKPGGENQHSGWTNQGRLHREDKEWSNTQTQGALSRTRYMYSFLGKEPYLMTMVTLDERVSQWQAQPTLLAESNI